MDQDKVIKEKVSDRFEAFKKATHFVVKPEFPRELLIEVTNHCNHACTFCAHRMMTRPKGVMALDLYVRLIEQAYQTGSREIGLYAGAEPLLCKELEQFVSEAKRIGYEYIYTTTNGTGAGHDRIKRIIDAGLDSIKFSVNGGTREVYQAVHGEDHFDRVLETIRFVDGYRKENKLDLKLFISFVATDESRPSFTQLKETIGAYVDDFYLITAVNVSGQNPELPIATFDPHCALPFNRISISYEGYMRVCCNDYQNLLTTEDLSSMSMLEAWNSPRMQEIRRQHLEDDWSPNLCRNCVTGDNSEVEPLNPELSKHPMIR
ncbi:radical SAM/SPASM domain-containing protein [Magnetococcus sp. PR-3]|uniref:radical SAM/SPASM domain-containing protein n=1 Tax=Magnetococcus sp. PR-3 TaxID=3120355 RepID=UPI002FCE4A77